MAVTEEIALEVNLAHTKNAYKQPGTPYNWNRLFFMLLGIGLFLGIYYSPPWNPVMDPRGVSFELSKEAKGALQVLFFIREPKVAFGDFMDPSVLFIFGSLTIGMVFTKSGLTKRLAYKMLSVIGERTSMIYLGCFFMTAILLLILSLDDLEKIPWNIILLFSGAMSICFCLWDTGAAKWLAVKWLGFFQNSSTTVFIMGMAFFVMIMTNCIMNVAAIAISLPVALVIAPYLGISGEAILFVSLVAAGMPFMLLVGAAPNAIAHSSRQFTAAQFFLFGIPASIVLMIVIWLSVQFIWPFMGMSIAPVAGG